MKMKKETVVKFLKGRPGAPVEFRDLMKAFGIGKADRGVFKDFIDELVDQGVLVRMPKRLFALAATGSAVAPIVGKLAAHRDGYGFVIPDDGGEDVFIPARYLRENMHGDRVEVRVVLNKRGGKREGRIIRTIEHGFNRIVGRFQKLPMGGRLLPDELRITQDVWIAAADTGGARDGEVVVAEITAYPTAVSGIAGRIVEVLGQADDPEVEVQLIIRKYDLPNIFPPAVLVAAQAVAPEVAETDLQDRTDLRNRLTITIDGETAKDFDDAVAVQRETDGAIRLWVSIADVSHYVKPGSPLDQEAYLRGTSVYFPDRCIPMLPEELSNGICSLNPQVDRLTMTAEMLFDRAGELQQTHFYPSVINSTARLTYTIVRKILVDHDPDALMAHSGLVADLEVMEELARRLTTKRRSRGSIDFDLPEPQIVLDLQGQTEAIIRAERNLAHKIIEEFMLAANEAVASHIEKQGIPSLYRIHEPPELLKLLDFQEFIFNFGYELRLSGDKVNPAEFQRILDQAEGKPEERMVNEVLLRCMKQARYAAENLGHFGLAADSYTHFTSPIRRYPDLVIHRILKQLITGKMTARDKDLLAEALPETAVHTSRRERVAMEAEREIVDLKKMQFMLDKIGAEYDGIITGVAHFGMFVELIELFVEGMVPVTSLKRDYYQYLEKQHALIGEHSRTQYRIGDRLRVRVAAVSLDKKQIEFVLVEVSDALPLQSFSSGNEEYPRIPVTGKRPAVAKGAGKDEWVRGGKGKRGKGSSAGRKG
jgi:ribonuclease R